MKTELNSSMLNSADYNSVERELTIEFSNGDEYKYKDVPEEIFVELSASPSAGKYFLAKIKNKFEYEKV
jgi:hypothetical protein